MKHKSLMVKIGFGGVVFVMLILIVSLQLRIHSLENEKNELEQKVEDHRLTVEEMEYDLDLPREEYIEKYAREVLGYHKYSDIILREESDE